MKAIASKQEQEDKFYQDKNGDTSLNVKYYPDDLMLDEDVIFSSKDIILPVYYYVTTKRVFSENKLTRQKRTIEYDKISDIHIEQNKLLKTLGRGNIIVMHSNYKGDIPLMRRKYFYLNNVKKPKESFSLLKKEISKRQTQQVGK